MDKIELNKWYAHESLDRSYLVMDMLDEYVIKHPFVEQSPELLKQANDVMEKLYELYNAIAKEGIKYENIS